MAAIAVGLPPTGLIVCLGEFLRGMGNVSNIYRRVLASSDIHCINLTWPPRRQKAGLWEARFPECSLRRRSGLGYETADIKERRGPRCCRLISAGLLLAGSRGTACTGEFWCYMCVCAATCMRPQLFVHVCVNAAPCTHAFLLWVCVCAASLHACVFALNYGCCLLSGPVERTVTDDVNY